MYSQNLEQQFIVNYFGDFKGSLLSVGENDGATFSNALKLIELGWSAVLVEPSPVAFKKLLQLHKGNLRVDCINCAIGTDEGEMTLYQSSHHLKDKSDVALLSSLKESETKKWKGVEFKPVKVNVYRYNTLFENSKFDFINIDAEGLDLEILTQINLSKTKLVCVEWNLNPTLKGQILDYCHKYSLDKIIYTSGENLIIGRK